MNDPSGAVDMSTPFWDFPIENILYLSECSSKQSNERVLLVTDFT